MCLTIQLCWNSVRADQCVIDVGGTAINIPTPAGCTHITNGMPGFSRHLQMRASGAVISLASFLPDDEVPFVRQNKLPPVFRTVDVSVLTNEVKHAYTQKEFSYFKQRVKASNQEQLTAAMKEAPDLSEVVRKLDDSTPANIETTFRGQVPLAPHAEDDHSLSYSLLSSRDPKLHKAHLTFRTQTYLIVKQKLLTLSVGVSPEDLKWSRDFSKTWAEEILAANQ